MITQNAVTRMRAMREIMATAYPGDFAAKERKEHKEKKLCLHFLYALCVLLQLSSALLLSLVYANLGSRRRNSKCLADAHTAGFQSWIGGHQGIEFDAIFTGDSCRRFPGAYCMGLHSGGDRIAAG